MRFSRMLLLTAVSLVPCTAVAQDAASVRARIVTRIGESGPREHAFGHVTGLAIDAIGTLYVSDGQDHQIVVFDASGAAAATLGRKGDGPGEFNYPTSLAIAPDGTLWVREQGRVQRFAPPSAGKPATKYLSVASLTLSDWMSERTGVVDISGKFHVPFAYLKTTVTPPLHVQMMQRLDASSREIVDSIMVPSYPDQPQPYASYMTGPRGGRILRGLNHVPFGPVAVWTATPRATIVSGDQRAYRIRETDITGKVVREYSRSVAPTRIPEGERRDSLRALQARIDSIPVPIESVLGMSNDVKHKRIPTHYPLFRELIVSTDGMLWVRRWPNSAEREVSRFDVFARDGRFVGSVHVDAEFDPSPSVVVNGAHAAGVRIDPDTGTEEIVRFEVPVKFRGSVAR